MPNLHLESKQNRILKTVAIKVRMEPDPLSGKSNTMFDNFAQSGLDRLAVACLRLAERYPMQQQQEQNRRMGPNHKTQKGLRTVTDP